MIAAITKDHTTTLAADGSLVELLTETVSIIDAVHRELEKADAESAYLYRYALSKAIEVGLPFASAEEIHQIVVNMDKNDDGQLR